ncbi:MAG: hypothetical protein HQL32_01230 [Planctomycetes bacterium]|nr:hypothetical protein [Planctomycetota bacterium]
MTNKTFPDFIFDHQQAEDFYRSIAEAFSFEDFSIHGNVVKKVIQGSEVDVNRRYFVLKNKDYTFNSYYYCEQPNNPEFPFSFRGTLIRNDLLTVEENSQEKQGPKNPVRILGSQMGLGYATPVDKPYHYNWGQIGCLTPAMIARKKSSQLMNDVSGSIKRLQLFDKDGRIEAKLIKWNERNKSGLLESELFKKVYISPENMPKKHRNNPSFDLKFKIRVVGEGKTASAEDVIVF